MQFQALATDYDGTLAHDGVVDAATIAALVRLKQAGRKLLLVSGRELSDLLTVFPQIDLFDLAVLENGAVIYEPKQKQTRLLAEPPPGHFAAELKSRGVTPLSTGHVIVATLEHHHLEVRRVMDHYELELEVIMNKGSLMVLPRGVDKATGLTAALGDLRMEAHQVVGVGDAENDQSMLELCGCGVAVSNALPSLKERANLVTRGARGFGVTELIDRILVNDLVDVRPLTG